jgi:hypothetical protein
VLYRGIQLTRLWGIQMNGKVPMVLQRPIQFTGELSALGATEAFVGTLAELWAST